MSQKFVYFLRPVGADGPIKIGCSMTPERRLKSLLIWSPLPLEIAAFAKGNHAYENALHYRFAADRIHGEWFSASSELTALIETVRTNGHLPPFDLRAVKRPKGAMARGTRENEALRYQKAALTRRIGEAERRVFGYQMHHGTGRPAHIRIVLDAMKGGGQPLPAGGHALAIEEYLESLAKRPAFAGNGRAAMDAWTAYRLGPQGFGKPMPWERQSVRPTTDQQAAA